MAPFQTGSLPSQEYEPPYVIALERYDIIKNNSESWSSIISSNQYVMYGFQGNLVSKRIFIA